MADRVYRFYALRITRGIKVVLEKNVHHLYNLRGKSYIRLGRGKERMNRGDGLREHQEFDMTGALERYVCVHVCV